MKDSLARSAPPEHIAERRELYSFVAAPKGGEIDSEVCDAIGQMCALGLLNDHGHDPVALRDKGRDWAGIYVKRMKIVGPKVASYERQSRTTGGYDGQTPEDLYFHRMDANLPEYERAILLSLLVDPLIGHGDTVPWAQGLIDERLMERGRWPDGRVMRFPDMQDRERLKACIRGLVILIDGALPSRWQERSAA